MPGLADSGAASRHDHQHISASTVALSVGVVTVGTGDAELAAAPPAGSSAPGGGSGSTSVVAQAAERLLDAIHAVVPDGGEGRSWAVHSSTPLGVLLQHAVCLVFSAVAPSRAHALRLASSEGVTALNARLSAPPGHQLLHVAVHAAQVVAPVPGDPRDSAALDAVETIEWLRYEYLVPLAALLPATQELAGVGSIFANGNKNYVQRHGGASAGPKGGAAAAPLSAEDAQLAKVLKRLKVACRLLTGRHDFGDGGDYGPLTRSFCRGVLPAEHGGGSCHLLLSLCAAPPMLPPRLLIVLIGMAVGAARHDSGGAPTPDAWRDVLLSGGDATAAPIQGLYLAEAAYDFAEARHSPEGGPALRLRTRPRNDEAEHSGEALAAVSVRTFRRQVQCAVIDALPATDLWTCMATSGPQALQPEPEPEPMSEAPPVFAPALAALQQLDHGGRWPAAPPRCHRRALVMANGGGEMLVLGVDPDASGYPFVVAPSAAEVARPELASALRALEGSLRDCPDERSTTMVVTRHAVTKPHTVQHIFSSAGRGPVAGVLDESDDPVDALVVALGDFSGGQMSFSGDGAGEECIRYAPRRFDGARAVCSSSPFRGARYTVCWYTPTQLREAAAVEHHLRPSISHMELAYEAGRLAASEARVAVVVPFRAAPGQSRGEQLSIFVRSLAPYLEKGRRDGKHGSPKQLGIFVIEQSVCIPYTIWFINTPVSH